MKVAVSGATGTIGRALVPHLALRHEVVPMSRRPPPAANGVQCKAANVTDADALRSVLTGVDVAYYLVHSLGAADFEERDRVAAQSTARAAEAASVRQLVYLGGLARGSADLSPHLRSREETAEVLASGGTGHHAFAPRWSSAPAAPPSRRSSRSSTGFLG